nr:PIN-like domain-containing protein [Flavobacterium ginsengisoli]
MKKEFYGFYAPNQTEIDKSWNEGIFVFDANTLLNLYRYSDSTRKDFLMALSKLKEKLHMPYQVGYEYHSNRNSVIENLDTSYYTLSASIKEICDKNITGVLKQYVRHPSIEVETLKKVLNEFVKKIETELEKQKKKHPDFKKEDEVLKQLTELYENKVGVPFSKDELKKIYTEGKERYDQLIPPGYKDLETKKKRGDQHIYGDLIIWKELISLTKKEKKK